MRDGPIKRGFMGLTGALDRRVGWHHLPKPLALMTLTGLRMTLRRHNLFDPSGERVGWGPELPPPGARSLVRTVDGAQTDPIRPDMGRAGIPFGRNVPIDDTYPLDVLEPNPRLISNELLARGEKFIPATTLNLLAAAWIQFEVHDWMSHGTNDLKDPWEIELGEDDPFPQSPMQIRRTHVAEPTTDGGPPTYRNTETHWWDASQVYTSSPALQDRMRTHRRGQLRLDSRGVIPFDPPNMSGLPPDVAGITGNWWLGLAMMHTLFMREHNSICDHLAGAYPSWDDQQLFDHARLINAALMAKIHTVEWTPSLLADSVMETGMQLNWWGVQGDWLWKRLGRLTKSEELSGIPGSQLYYHGAPYAMTEEFVSVYRMHPLIPDDYLIRSWADDGLIDALRLNQLAGRQTINVLSDTRIEMPDLFYSFGTSHPGAIALHNFPNELRCFEEPDPDQKTITIDLAAIDILRSRERGVPRYNEFRRKFHLKPASRFEDFSDDPGVVADLRRIYRDPEAVDLMVGLYAEKPPAGFAFSDTAFRVFILMASRRLKSDRFYTYDYRPEVYTKQGLRWIEDNTMKSVILRHYPNLAGALSGVDNAFKPWNTAGTVLSAARWQVRRAFWNWLVTFKFRHAKPVVIPRPVREDRPLRLVPFSDKFARVPIPGLFVADHVPRDERQTLKLRFCQLQALLYRLFSPMQKGLPSIDPDPGTALANAYTAAHRRCYPAPVRPAAYGADVDLGEIAVASPYACYLEHDESDRYHWDLRSLEKVECHAGIRPPVALVEFAVDPSEGRLAAVRIDCDYGSCKPGEQDWPAAQRLALCAVATHLSLVRHFNWIHLVAGSRMSITTRTCLPVDHPIRRLLWPHVYATESSNQMVTIDQMDPGGDFENVFSFTHAGMCRLFEATCGDFDLRMIHPAVDAERRGVGAVPFATPALDNRTSLMAVMRDHVSRYLAVYFDSDDAVARDGPLAHWLEDLAAGVPGVVDLAGTPVTLDGSATLLSTLIYLATVEHEIVGSGVWNYQLWPDVQPVRLHLDGTRQPLDNYQRLVNANFNLNVHRTPLMSDFSGLALDRRGAEAFERFRLDLSELQSEMDGEPATPWRMEPRVLKANINA